MTVRARKEQRGAMANGHSFDLRNDRQASGVFSSERSGGPPPYLIGSEMLLILLTAAWLSTVLMALGICRMAAHGDAQLESFADPHPRSIGGELAIREDPPDVALQDRRKRAGVRRLTAPGD